MNDRKNRPMKNRTSRNSRPNGRWTVCGSRRSWATLMPHTASPAFCSMRTARIATKRMPHGIWNCQQRRATTWRSIGWAGWYWMEITTIPTRRLPNIGWCCLPSRRTPMPRRCSGNYISREIFCDLTGKRQSICCTARSATAILTPPIRLGVPMPTASTSFQSNPAVGAGGADGQPVRGIPACKSLPL